jgi:Reverse transcriptase (RNA-dependent DNA polymerase)
MQKIISITQTAFIKGQSIIDNAILMKEIIHLFGCKNYTEEAFALKVDITKAFDTLEWDFIQRALKEMQMPRGLIKLIMSCIRSSRLTVLVNGVRDGFLTPTRGLRQGCPMSPYLVIVAMEFLTKIFNKAQEEGRLQGVCLAPTAPILTHSIYADDLVIFAKASW